MNVSWLHKHHVEQGRTGTKFQAGKSHTHPGHPIHPQQIMKPQTTLFFCMAIIYIYKKRFKTLGCKIIKGSLLNFTFTSIFFFSLFIFHDSSVHLTLCVFTCCCCCFLQIFLYQSQNCLHLFAKQPPHCIMFAIT